MAKMWDISGAYLQFCEGTPRGMPAYVYLLCTAPFLDKQHGGHGNNFAIISKVKHLFQIVQTNIARGTTDPEIESIFLSHLLYDRWSHLHMLLIWSPDGITRSVSNMVTGWSYLHYFPNWPPGCVTRIASEFGEHVPPLGSFLNFRF